MNEALDRREITPEVQQVINCLGSPACPSQEMLLLVGTIKPGLTRPTIKVDPKLMPTPHGPTCVDITVSGPNGEQTLFVRKCDASKAIADFIGDRYPQ